MLNVHIKINKKHDINMYFYLIAYFSIECIYCRSLSCLESDRILENQYYVLASSLFMYCRSRNKKNYKLYTDQNTFQLCIQQY